MGCDIHMSVEIREVSGYSRSDRFVRNLQREAAEDPAALEAIERIERREGPWIVAAIETWCPEGVAVVPGPGWRAVCFPWSWATNPSPTTGDWVVTTLRDVPTPWWEDRDYESFARLAGVRNSQGVIPISEPRGLPADYAPTSAVHEEGWEQFELGDHSHSWLLAREVLEYEGWGVVDRQGQVELQVYREWKKAGTADPSSWCIRSSGTSVVSEGEVPGLPEKTYGRTMVQCSWTSPRKWPFVEMVNAWADRFGADSVRFTFGFDS